MLRNLRCLKARLRLLCNKISRTQHPEPRFKTALVSRIFIFGMAYCIFEKLKCVVGMIGFVLGVKDKLFPMLGCVH